MAPDNLTNTNTVPYSLEFYPQTRIILFVGQDVVRSLHVTFEPIVINRRSSTFAIRFKHSDVEFSVDKKDLKDADIEILFETLLQWQREYAQDLNNHRGLTISQNDQ